MREWKSNHNSARGRTFRPRADEVIDPFSARRVCRDGPPNFSDELMRKATDLIIGAGVPAWAIENLHRFQSPKDYLILACVSEYARMHQGIADLTAAEVGIHCDLPEAYVAVRIAALIGQGCLVCDGRRGDRYFLRVPPEPPTRWSTGPPHNAA